MPAAALDPEDRQWRTKRRGNTEAGYLFHHKALAKVFRAKMLAAIAAAGLPLPARHPPQWIAHCKGAGTGKPALIYLGRYLYRGVIREQDILACGNAPSALRFAQCQDRQARAAHRARRGLPLADPPARAAQGLPARA